MRSPTSGVGAGGAIPAHSQPINSIRYRSRERFSRLFVRQEFSDVADVREHLLAEQFERFHQRVGAAREFWHLAHARARKKASKSAIFARVGISLVTLTHWFSLIPIS